MPFWSPPLLNLYSKALVRSKQQRYDPPRRDRFKGIREIKHIEQTCWWKPQISCWYLVCWKAHGSKCIFDREWVKNRPATHTHTHTQTHSKSYCLNLKLFWYEIYVWCRSADSVWHIWNMLFLLFLMINVSREL